MNACLFPVLFLLPAISSAAAQPKQSVMPDPPGLRLRIPLPQLNLVPVKPLPSQTLAPSEALKMLPGLSIKPTTTKTPMRLLVFRDDDRKATKTFYPLLTPDVPVLVLPLKPAIPGKQAAP